MLTNFEVLLYASSVIVVLPIAIYSLLTGSKAPEGNWIAKYYAAEKYLGLAGNVFLLAVCANGLVKLGLHFGFIDPALTDSADLLLGVPFMALLVLYLGLWVRAALKVRRNANGETRP
jgi:hypothetical protein